MNIRTMLLGGILAGLCATTSAETPQLPAFPALPAASALQADSAGEIFFDTRTPYDFDILLSGYDKLPQHRAMGTLVLPAGASSTRPVPAVVLVHGSGGIMPGREARYAALLADNGFAAIYIDYYRPRGITSDTPYQAKTTGVTEFDAVSDAYAALRALNAHPAIDGKRVAVMGFSYGGMATRIAMDARVRAAIAPELPPFAAHVDYYGPCFQDFRLQQTTGAPLLSLRGAEDASNDLVACAQRETELRAAGSAVSSFIFARAGHSWEVNAPRKLGNYPYLAGCLIEYDDAGMGSVDGTPLVPASAPADRDERFRLRLAQGDALGPCVKIGYISGRDDDTRVQSDYHMLHFLRETLLPATAK